MESIAGRVAFMSGGSRRIGAAVARLLADNVARVALRPVTEPSWG